MDLYGVYITLVIVRKWTVVMTAELTDGNHGLRHQCT